MKALLALLAVALVSGICFADIAPPSFYCPSGQVEDLQCAAACCEQAGGTYERGASLAVCSSISPDLHLSMGVARCKNPKDLGTVRCALPDGRDYLDPRESVYWLQGYPQFLPNP